MRKLVISTLSSLVPVEIKRAFQEIQNYFNQVNNEGGVTTADSLASGYYSKVQADGKYEVKSNKVTSLSGTSTDIQYPSAKLMFDQLALKEDLANKVTSISVESTDDQYPSAKLLYDQLELKEDVANKVTSLSDTSTNEEYPSAKAVYDELQAKSDVFLEYITGTSTPTGKSFTIRKYDDGTFDWEELI